MKLAKFHEIVEVNSLDELHHHLLFRHNEIFGSFWLWHPGGAELGVMINGLDAYLFSVSSNRASPSTTLQAMTRPDLPITYVGGRGPSIYQSFSEHTESPDEPIEFLADNYEPTPRPRLYTVPLHRALTAIEHFFATGERSESVPWQYLEPPPPRPRPKPWWRRLW